MFPIKLFLRYDVVQIQEDSLFLPLVKSIISRELDFFLDRIELINFLVFLLENVAKVGSIPRFNVPFHLFHLLGNSVHSSAINLEVPRRGDFSFQHRMGEPHFLKAKRECPFAGMGGDRERYRGVI